MKPDIVTLGKSIACGVPLSAIAARPGVMDEVGPRKVAHAGTYNSNPLAMAACLASLDHILTEEALARSSRLNDRLAKGYAEVFDDADVDRVRQCGRGLGDGLLRGPPGPELARLPEGGRGPVHPVPLPLPQPGPDPLRHRPGRAVDPIGPAHGS